VRNRSGEAYKPSTWRGYEEALRLRVLPELGARRLREVTRAELQRFVGGLRGSPQTIHNTVMPLRAVFSHALAHGDVRENPTEGLRLPASRGRRAVGVDSPGDAATLIEHAPDADRALWATALYAGLRLGELRALQWRDVDFERGTIRVERSMDRKEGAIEPKSAAGRRSVPLPAALREQLPEPGESDAFMFARSNAKPFDGPTVSRRAARAWRAAGIDPVTMHQCRHAYASMMIAAGANAKALSTYMGHANIATTMDRYGHLMAGNEREAAERFDRYLSDGAEMGRSDPASNGFERSQPDSSPSGANAERAAETRS